MGLGYHIKALYELDDGIYIDIIEPDMQIIYNACKSQDLSWLLTNDRIRLIYDKDCTKFTKYLSENVSFIIHYPSLRHVSNEEIKMQIEKYFISDSGKRNFHIQFANNFRDNIRNCDRYIDEAKKLFENKHAIIVAAGPSLDKNVELIRNHSDNIVVVAVGTVFRKLIDLEIRPDFVVFLDVQPNMYSQIEGLENLDIPLVCASTSYKKIAAEYKGPKYMICQNGYDKAEEYAKENGYNLYETGGSVSTIALDLCLKMGCMDVAFIGLDLAFTEGRTHACNANDSLITEQDATMSVIAQDGNMVATRRLFIMYREWIERRVEKLDASGKVYDATEGGACKKGLIRITLSELLEKWNS